MTTPEKPNQNLPIEIAAKMLAGEKSMLYNVALFQHAQRVAQLYASSTMVPDHFKGSVGNCFIALNYAHRIGADEFMVLQNIYTVHGRPGIEAKLVIALVNQNGKYKKPGLHYEERGNITKPENGEDGCRAYAFDSTTGDRVDGPWVTWNTVKAEGWYDKKGPDGTVNSNKWRTMPELMFSYRSASWFTSKNCPEVKLGMSTVEELNDIVELVPAANGSYGAVKGKTEDKINDLKDRLKDKDTTAIDGTGPWERSLWINLKTTGFPTYVRKCIDSLKDQPQEIIDAVRAKWVVGLHLEEPFPLDIPPTKDSEPEKENSIGNSKTPEQEEQEEHDYLRNDIIQYEPDAIKKAQQDLNMATGVLPRTLDGLRTLQEKLVENAKM